MTNKSNITKTEIKRLAYLARLSISNNEAEKYAKQLDVHKDILNAPPTDGLWEDNRTDQDQLGLSYEILEQCMENKASDEHQKKYNKIRKPNLHKIIPIPICKLT